MKPDYKIKEIGERIYKVRGIQVMIDRDLAELYGVETKQLNRAVKRNIERFPEDFMFQLTKEECLRCQIGTLNTGQGQHMKYLPYAFTEYGIAMLSGILRSETAIAANIRIMRTFASISKQMQLDIDKHNSQYPPVEVGTFTKAHDRFLIIDDQVYLIGASIKDLGKKWFGFTLMENTSAEELLERM